MGCLWHWGSHSITPQFYHSSTGYVIFLMEVKSQPLALWYLVHHGVRLFCSTARINAWVKSCHIPIAVQVESKYFSTCHSQQNIPNSVEHVSHVGNHQLAMPQCPTHGRFTNICPQTIAQPSVAKHSSIAEHMWWFWYTWMLVKQCQKPAMFWWFMQPIGNW